jgi:hypothetical protein
MKKLNVPKSNITHSQSNILFKPLKNESALSLIEEQSISENKDSEKDFNIQIKKKQLKNDTQIKQSFEFF